MIHAERHDVFEHANDGGKRGEAHENKEQRAPQLAAPHLVEYARQRDEYQVGARIGRNAIGEAGGENNQAREQRNERGKAGDACRLTRQATVASDVAAENRHARSADGKREECLSHGGVYRIAKAIFNHLSEVGHKVELKASLRAGQHDRIDGQNHDGHEQARHHDLRHALNAVLQAQANDEKADAANNDHPEQHLERVGEQRGKRLLGSARCACGSRCAESRELAGRHFERIGDHPAGDGGVEHHQNVVARECEPFIPMPFGALGLQNVVASRAAFLARTAHGIFHNQDRQAENYQKHQVKQHERRAAIFAAYIWEAPDVAKANGASGRNKNEADARAEFLAAFGGFGRGAHACAPVGIENENDGHANAAIGNVQTRALYAAKRAHAKSVRAARAPSYRRPWRSARATRAFCVVGR